MTLVERLRAAQLRGNTAPADMHLLEEAADRIAELEAVLQEVGKLPDKWRKEVREAPEFPADLFVAADMLKCGLFWADGCANELRAILDELSRD